MKDKNKIGEAALKIGSEILDKFPEQEFVAYIREKVSGIILQEFRKLYGFEALKPPDKRVVDSVISVVAYETNMGWVGMRETDFDERARSFSREMMMLNLTE